jgi:hypothetical protein
VNADFTTDRPSFTLHSRLPRRFTREVTAGQVTSSFKEIMSDNKETDIIRIDLTAEQKEQVKAATEKSAEAIELTVQELEARIAPRFI